MTKDDFTTWAQHGVLVLDGAMGTMIPTYGGVTAGDYSMLCLTRPEVISDIHRQYINAGADIISTNTITANAIAMQRYASTNRCSEINRRGAMLARQASDSEYAHSGRRVLVAGSIGPMSQSVSAGEMCSAYSEQIDGLMEGGVDLLLMETIYNMQSLRAALTAAANVMNRRGSEMAIMVSFTLSTAGEAVFSDSNMAEFIAVALQSPHTASVGLNCSFGSKEMIPHLKRLANLSPTLITAHPNAGLPDSDGKYAETPAIMADNVAEMLNQNLVNVVGGCCGTTPQHIRRIAELVKRHNFPTRCRKATDRQ
jgi:5-methyltetrahydrofolate--homocysteine methyltransferase